jgi:hypothetical protein
MIAKSVSWRLQLSALAVAGSLCGVFSVASVSLSVTGCQSYPSETPRPRPPRPGATDPSAPANPSATASPEKLPARGAYGEAAAPARAKTAAEAKPAEPTAAETKPAEPTAAETKPAEPTAAEPKEGPKDEVPVALPLP